MGETAVTQGEWSRLMGNNPSRFQKCGETCPVEQVSWLDAVAFANRLSDEEGFNECYRIHGSKVSFVGLECNGFRLPTEAEWEYAARAETTTLFWTGSNLTKKQANFRDYGKNQETTTVSVRTFPANPLGLYEVHGNVWEWVWDWYGEYTNGLATDPTGPEGGSYRVRRGGSYCHDETDCRSAYRDYGGPGRRYRFVGFRLVRTAIP